MINIVAAFKTEVEPIIRQFSMRKVASDGHYQEFIGSGYRVIISGMGAVNAAKATEAGLLRCSVGRWLNFGIAGSGGYAIGDLVFARQVTEASTGQSWLLEAIEGAELTGHVYTVPKMQTSYGGSLLYDMEAAGFMQSLDQAGRIGDGVTLKLVSDGPSNVDTVNLGSIRRLIDESGPSIIRWVSQPGID